MITELTREQKAMIPRYIENGIRVGYAKGPDFDEEKVKLLINKHRELCGLKGEVEYFHVYDSPWAAVAAHKELTPSNAMYGQHDIHWLNYYNFYREEMGLKKETDKIKYLLELANYIGWWWMSSNAVIISRRPETVSTYIGKGVSEVQNERLLWKRLILHNEDDMAIKYRDGRGLYYLHGTPIPEDLGWIVRTPAEELYAQKILEIKNVDIRVLAQEKMGLHNFIKELAPTCLHEKTFPIGGKYRLLHIDFPNEAAPRTYLQMICPSKKDTRVEAVHPDIKTVDAALGWRVNLSLEMVLAPDFVYEEPEAQS